MYESLKKKTVSGFFWSFSELISKYGINFIIQIFLARLLLPEDFGLIGMITIFIAVSQSIIDSGFGNALIRERNSSQEDYSTVFFYSVFAAILMYILLYCSANAISDFFSEPKLTLIIRVLAIVLIINSFGLIQRTVLTKNIDFKTQTKIVLFSSIVSGIAAIILASFGFGVWCLVIRNIIMQLLETILLCFNNKWLPSLIFSTKSFKRLFGFGWKLLVSGLVNTVYINIYLIIIGKFFSVINLGYYTNAKKISDLASNSFTSSVQRVSYPVLSSMNDRNDSLFYGYKKLLTHTVFVGFFISFLLAASADNLIPVLFGEKWLPSVPYFQVLCFASVLYPVHAINLNILQVKGRSDLFLKLEIIKKTISTIGIVLILIFKREIMVLLWFNVFASLFAYYLNSYYSKQLINYSFLEQLKDISPCFIISLLMAIVVYLIGKIKIDNNTFTLFIQLLIGSSIYFIVSRALKIEGYKISNIMIYNLKRRKRD